MDIYPFFKHFKGSFRGTNYDCNIPPPTIIPNHSSCQEHAEEIVVHLEERLANGSLELLGRVGEVTPPRLVMPLVMVTGPKKNRLCHDERFLNLFMTKASFSLETLPQIPTILPEGALMANCDEKSAYDGVSLTPASRDFFGVQFGGWFMRYTTLPFGWSLSPYIYQTIGMAVTSFLRGQGITTLQCLDDRFIGPMFTSEEAPISAWERTYNATTCTIATLSALGYTLALEKSVLSPSNELRFLGFNVHSDSRQFSIPEDKLESFQEFRDSILRRETVHVKTLQKLMGKCISFSNCVPAAKLYSREMAAVMAKAAKHSRPICISVPLREEIEHWRFIDSNPRWLPWRAEKHIQVTLATDSSTFAWGATVGNRKITDMWPNNDKRPIHVKEAHALLKTLQAISKEIADARVDAMVDNTAVVHAWTREGSKDVNLNAILKQMSALMISLNCDLHLTYIPSAENPADEPSRKLSPSDAMLAPELWEQVERWHGPHSFDLMALDSNAPRDQAGSPLPHFSPYPLPLSTGVNMFGQQLSATENYYCFPPFCMTGQVLKFFLEADIRPLHVTLLIAKLTPVPTWWPLLESLTVPCPLAKKGDSAVLMPSKKGYIKRQITFDLYAARLSLA